MYSRLLQKFKILSLALLLSGCGGGGGSSTDNGNGGTGIDSNDPPVANTGILFTNVSTTGLGTLLASDPEGDTLTFSIVANGTLGTAVITNINTGEYTYTPNPDVEGTDVFTFKVNDGVRDSNIAVITVHIEFDDAPVANNNTYTLNEGAILNIGTAAGVLANDSDDEDQPLSAILITNVTHGALTLNSNGSFVYAHDGSETTSDSFTYRANDGSQDSNIATVTLVINPVNDPPVANNDVYTVDEGGTLVIIAPGVLINDTDAEGSLLSTVLVSGPTHTSNFSLNANGSFTYVHNGSETTSDSFTYRASDGSTISNTATVTITINPVNDAPVAVNNAYTVNEGGTLNIPVSNGVLTNDTDAEGNTLTAILVSGPTHSSSFTLNTSGSFSYSHNGSETLTDSFTYRASDGITNSNIATVSITITPINDPPGAVNDSYLVNEGETLTINAANGVLDNDTDAEGNVLTAVLVTGPAHASSFSLNQDGSFSYTHDGSANYADSFIYRASDGNAVSSSATVSITINRSPTANAGPAQYVPEGKPVTLSGSGFDPDGSIAEYTWTQIDNSGISVTLTNANSATASFTAPDVPASPPQTTLTFRLTVTDNLGASGTSFVNIVVSNILFSDDFSDGDMNGWTRVHSPSFTSNWTVISGELYQTSSVGSIGDYIGTYHQGSYAYLTAGTGSPDYRFSVDATFLATKLGEDIGVMFRYTNSNNYYRFSMNSRYGFSRLEKKVGGTFTPLATTNRGYTFEQLLQITVDVKGSLIQIFLNGDPLFAVNDTSLSSGTVALYTQDLAKFDNVLVQPPSAAPIVVLASPLAHSVTAGDTLQVSAVALTGNVPTGGYVEFRLDGVTSIVDSTPPYNTIFSGLAQGDHTVEAILRDINGTELSRDTNVMVGARGNYYVAVGDSIVNGGGDKYSTDNITQDGRIIAFHGYEANLTDLLNGSLDHPNVVANEGIGGDESVDAALPPSNRIASILARHTQSNKMLILYGTNDANSSVPHGLNCSGSSCNGTFKGNMQALINAVNAAGKEAWIARVPPIFGSATPFANPATASINTNFVQKFNDVINTQLTGHQIGPDFYSYFLGAGVNRYSLFYDTLHPNALGYVVMAHLWHNSLNSVSPVQMPFILENLTPSTVSPFLKQNLIETGDVYYTDATHTITGPIPSALTNGRWIMTANADRNNASEDYVSFSVDRPVTVYIAYDGGASSLPAWMSGYVDSGMTLATNDPQTPVLRLYSKYNSAGPITLGGNLQGSATGADSNYIAIVVAN